jgi:UDP-N-acetylmuramyl pentapeptide phosphotransferase/UDP-N-acetylglucosamine-1-phosphate transferase
MTPDGAVVMEALSAGLMAFGVSAFLTRRFCDPQSWLHILDHPNDRSLHSNPTPRSGGVAIVAGIVVGATIWAAWAGAPCVLAWLGGGALLVGAISFLDDMKGLSVGARFAGHLAVSGLLVIGGLGLTRVELPGVVWDWPAWAGRVFSVLYLIWMINLYNFMDGMDGFAGGMAIFGFGTFALLGMLAGHPAFAAASLIVATGATGFLLFNFPPARIFMGDTGSSALGLLAGGFSLWGVADRVFPLWAALLVFSPFIVDASATLIRRLWRGERVWEAHKTHYYQRLVQSGWGHRKTVLAEYGLMAACGASAVVGSQLDIGGQWLTIIGWCVVYPVLMVLVTRFERRALTSA